MRNISRRESGLRPNSIVLVQNGWSPNELAQWDQNYFELALYFLYRYDFTRYFPKFQSLIQILKKLLSIHKCSLSGLVIFLGLTTYRKVTISNTSRLESHAYFSRLLMKGIFDPYVLCVTF